MTTLTSVPTQVVGHPALTPEPTTDAGRLRSVALGRSVVADLLGGWLVQGVGSVATGAPSASGLVDIAVLDDPSPARLAEVAALISGGSGPAVEAGPAVWSTGSIASADGWDRGTPRTLVHLPARRAVDPGVDLDAGPPRTSDVRRVDDPARLAQLGAADRLGLTVPIGLALLADERIRAWTADGRTGAGLLIAVVVGYLDVAAVAAGEAAAVSALLREWRDDRPDLDGVAVVEPAVVDVLDRSHPVRTSPVHVATLGPRIDHGGRA